MARKLRVEYKGAIYHVTLRGVERRRLFDDAADRERMVERLGDYAEEYGLRVYLYCLMANHVHVVVETPEGNLGAFMHRLETAYTVYYNRRHGRAGHLMQGRYGAVPVEGDEYLLKLSRYVHLNPVFVGALRGQGLKERIQALRAYPWSSYRGYIGKGKPERFVERGPVLKLAGGGGERGYRKYVESGLVETDEEMAEVMKDPGFAIGGEGFQGWIKDLHDARVLQSRRQEDASFRRQMGRPLKGGEIVEEVSRVMGVAAEALAESHGRGMARPVAARMLGKYGGLRQRDVATVLGLRTGAAVSVQLARLAKAMSKDVDLARRVATIDRRLEAQRTPASQTRVP